MTLFRGCHKKSSFNPKYQVIFGAFIFIPFLVYHKTCCNLWFGNVSTYNMQMILNIMKRSLNYLLYTALNHNGDTTTTTTAAVFFLLQHQINFNSFLTWKKHTKMLNLNFCSTFFPYNICCCCLFLIVIVVMLNALKTFTLRWICYNFIFFCISLLFLYIKSSKKLKIYFITW